MNLHKLAGCGLLLVLLTTGKTRAQGPPPNSSEEALPPLSAPCVPEGGDPGMLCGPRFWAQADFLYWWTKDSHLPPLVTTGSPLDLEPGQLGQPGTRVLIGGDIDNEGRMGGRLTLGYAFVPDQFGVEGSYFFLAERSVHFGAESPGTPGSPLLALVGLDNPGPQGTLGLGSIIASPGIGRQMIDAYVYLSGPGGIRVSLSDWIQGAEANGVMNLAHTPTFRFDLLGGFRYLQMDETLHVNFHSNLLTSAHPFVIIEDGPPGIPGSTGFTNETDINESDTLATRNHFYGGQVGARTQFNRGPLFVQLAGKIALGVTHEAFKASSSTTLSMSGGYVDPFGQPQSAGPGVVSTLPDASYHKSYDRFTVVPEVGINLGYQITQYCSATIGYTFLYSSDVLRPGDQLNNLMTGGKKDSDFWAQGLNAGLQFTY